MWPGTLVANETEPGYWTARYSVMKMLAPAAARLRTPKNPPPPPIWVCVVIPIEAVIQESSPLSENTLSSGLRSTSRTGMGVPRMRACIGMPPVSGNSVSKAGTAGMRLLIVVVGDHVVFDAIVDLAGKYAVL